MDKMTQARSLPDGNIVREQLIVDHCATILQDMDKYLEQNISESLCASISDLIG